MNDVGARGQVDAIPVAEPDLAIRADGDGFGQTGFMVSQEALKPKLDNLNPGSAIKKIFGMKNLIEFLKSL